MSWSVVHAEEEISMWPNEWRKSTSVLTASGNSLGAGHLTVFLVHVVGTGAGVVSDPDTEVLRPQWVLLEDLEIEQSARQ